MVAGGVDEPRICPDDVNLRGEIGGGVRSGPSEGRG